MNNRLFSTPAVVEQQLFFLWPDMPPRGVAFWCGRAIEPTLTGRYIVMRTDQAVTADNNEPVVINNLRG